MLIVLLFILSTIISLISLFYSISSGYFDYTQHEKQYYKQDANEMINQEKEKIINKYYPNLLFKPKLNKK